MTRIWIRMALSLFLATGMLAAAALPAVADEELDELLDEIGASEFSGSQIIITTWDGVTEVSVVEIDHRGDITIVDGGGGAAMLGRGKAMRSGSDNGAAVSAWNDVSTERYTVEMGQMIPRFGRDVQKVEIHEGSLLRARMTIDVESGAPIVTEVFDGNGSRFRYSAMLEFSPWSEGVAEPVTAPVFDVSLPLEDSYYGELAGYEQADTYTAPDESKHSFFSDGLFSFSLFEFDGSASFDDDNTMSEFTVNRREYRRRVTATDVYVTWEARGATYVLVGDLPPDHLEDVLAELPRPRRRGLFSRIWNGIFG